jgi:hypothetical protein
MTKCNILRNWLLRRGWGFIKLAQIASVNKTLKDKVNWDICEKLRAIREAEKDLDVI